MEIGSLRQEIKLRDDSIDANTIKSDLKDQFIEDIAQESHLKDKNTEAKSKELEEKNQSISILSQTLVAKDNELDSLKNIAKKLLWDFTTKLLVVLETPEKS